MRSVLGSALDDWGALWFRLHVVFSLAELFGHSSFVNEAAELVYEYRPIASVVKQAANYTDRRPRAIHLLCVIVTIIIFSPSLCFALVSRFFFLLSASASYRSILPRKYRRQLALLKTPTVRRKSEARGENNGIFFSFLLLLLKASKAVFSS